MAFVIKSPKIRYFNQFRLVDADVLCKVLRLPLLQEIGKDKHTGMFFHKNIQY